MLKNLAPLTYKKSFWHWGTTIWVIIVFCSMCETTRTGSLRSKKNSQKNRYSNKQSLLYLLIWSPCNLQKYQNRKQFRVTISGDQNVKKHGENIGSKLTNHKMTKFPERSEVCLFSLQEALCFYFNVIASFIKKSLTSFVLNKHVHWFIFLHFDPVQIVSLFWVLYRFPLHSITSWVIGSRLLLSWLLHCYFEY